MSKDFETWYNESRDFLKLDNWTEEIQYLIYEGDELLGINGKWITARLSDCDKISIYQMYITKAKTGLYADCELLEKYRKELYWHCTQLIARYCFD